MKRLFLIALLAVGTTTFANVVRLGPNFSWQGAGKTTSLRSLRGQPVVLLVARSPRVGAFKAQVKKIKELYQEFSSKQVVFVVAFREGDGEVKSDIPFAIATNGERVATEYEVNGDFNIIVIGKDGNVDLQTPKVCPASRVRDVINNSFEAQAAARK